MIFVIARRATFVVQLKMSSDTLRADATFVNWMGKRQPAQFLRVVFPQKAPHHGECLQAAVDVQRRPHSTNGFSLTHYT